MEISKGFAIIDVYSDAFLSQRNKICRIFDYLSSIMILVFAGTSSDSDDEISCHSLTMPRKVIQPSLEPVPNDSVCAVAGASGSQLQNDVKKVGIRFIESFMWKEK